MINSFKQLTVNFVASLSPSLFFRIAYIHNRHRWPSFKHPRDISEIWIRYLFDGIPAKHYTLADKYLVRKYVKARLPEGEYLTPLIGVWDKPSDIDFDNLPERFALKIITVR